ncbi:transporter substrate-binding domain-containing protein [uncultured Deinococcus sp.]|uniref:substrate-binding periplasmic protein n=1 Tax=uncultured Deinococcus sp. TaxID=158789 RepID=UPI002589C8F8|nr:transporter substrate-binding domain-containing protein [uncultured Deinococcus sp.]
MLSRRILTLLALPLLLLGGAQARPYDQIRDIGVLRVGMPGDVAPFNLSAGKSMVGFEPDLIQEVARAMNLRVIFEQVPADDLLTALDQDKVDLVMNNLVITSTRENRFDFSVPYNCSGVSIASLGNYDKNTDLTGKTIAVPRNSIFETYVGKLPFEKTVKPFDTNVEVIRAVLTGQADATYAFTAMGPTFQRLYPKLPIHFSPALWSSPNGIAIKGGNESLRQAVNVSLGRYLRTPAYKALLNKYFAQDTSCKS